MIWATGFLSLTAGFGLGMFFQDRIFHNQHWMVMKWSPDALGYRPVMVGSSLFKEDKVAMSLEIDTSKFPEEGFTVE